MSGRDEWVTGVHAVAGLLSARAGAVRRLVLQRGRRDRRLEPVREAAGRARIPVEEVDRAELDALCGASHRGVAAQVAEAPRLLTERDLPGLLDGLARDPLLLALDGVTDPRNLGAVLRTADAAGVDAVIVPRDRAAGMGATVSRAASGAAEAVTVAAVTNLARALAQLKARGVWVVGADARAPRPLYRQDLTGPLALVMGSEGGGLRRLVRERCDFLVSIPMAGRVGNLNVSVAAGVALFEAVRQRS